MARIGFVTLGCPKNEADTDAMRASVLSSGHSIVDDIDEADIVILNTCSFIQEATVQSIEMALELAQEWVPAREGRKLVLAGCLPSRYSDGLDSELAEVDAFVPVADEATIARVIRGLLDSDEAPGAEQDPGQGEAAQVAGAPDVPGVPEAQSRRVERGPSAYIKISDGCDRACTYCAIPHIRGAYRSKPLADILAEARELIVGGTKELILIGQDTTDWGKDLPGGLDLADLLREVASLSATTWIRVMYLQPEGVTDRLLDAWASLPTVCNYFDLPLQHASKRVLRAMKRRGSGEEFLALLARIRAAIPEAVIRTTLIAGFPTETREEARELLEFVEKADLDYVGVFVYSQEEGTEAALLDQVPMRTRRSRAQRLRDRADEIGFARCGKRIGEEHDVLFEGVDEDEEGVVFLGRWMGQAPEIDGQVHCTEESIATEDVVGTIVRIRFTDSFCYEFEGEKVLR